MQRYQDSLLSLLDRLCRERGYRRDKGGPGERGIAELVAEELRAHSWLTVTVDDLGGGFFNVLALDGDPSEVEFLVVGHLDTVTPSPGWTKREFTDDGTNYYALGAVDTRGGIAGALDAIGKAGPTRKVAYLFYGDEEVDFVGMREFVRMHPEVAPKLGLSVCGGKGEAYLGWRGCTEMEFYFRGVSGHASRPWDGANAAEAAAHVMEAVRRACVEFPGALKTSANIAAVHCGSFDAAARESYVFGAQKQVPPPIQNVANKIPDVGWALLDVRVGDLGVTPAFIKNVASRALAAWNAAKEHSVALTVAVNFAMPSFVADRELVEPVFCAFHASHGGKVRPPATTGFLDTTLVSGAHGTQFMCLSPTGGNEHSADEYVSIQGLRDYRDGLVGLLGRYKA
jgi:succinyl-diaminopimelate desuccinylase